MISPVEIWVAEKAGLSDILSAESLLLWKKEKLQEQIRYADENCRFYHGKLTGKRDLNDLPFTYPTDLVNDPLAFLAIPQRSVARITTLTTSGTTGAKKRIYFSAGDLERIIEFFAVGMSTLVHHGQSALILLSDQTENSLGNLLRTALSRMGVASFIAENIQQADQAIIAAQGIDCLIGMPAEIHYMSQVEPGLHPKSILLTADYIPQGVIRNIQNNWGSQVFTHYGLTEVGFGCAVDCDQHSGHHLRDADVWIEIIDPQTNRPAMPGESGEITLTTLRNEAMPLIRYRTGDFSHFIYEPCRCGGQLPRIGAIKGRYANALSLADGSTFSIHQLDEWFFAIPEVNNYIASYDDKRNHLVLTIDSVHSIDICQLKDILPGGIEVQVRYEKLDPFSHRGKRTIQSLY